MTLYENKLAFAREDAYFQRVLQATRAARPTRQASAAPRVDYYTRALMLLRTGVNLEDLTNDLYLRLFLLSD